MSVAPLSLKPQGPLTPLRCICGDQIGEGRKYLAVFGPDGFRGLIFKWGCSCHPLPDVEKAGAILGSPTCAAAWFGRWMDAAAARMSSHEVH